MTHASRSDRPGLGGAAIGFPLLVLLAIVWPFGTFPLPGPFALGPLVDDPYPHLAGAALVCVAAVVPALVLLRGSRQIPVRGFVPLVVAWAAGLSLAFFAEPTDSVTLQAALVGATGALVLFLAGARLGHDIPRELSATLVLVTLVLLGRALWGGLAEPRDFAGVLGNSGPLSQAALPGALAGAFLAARSEKLQARVLGALAVLLFALHAGLAPVLAGVLAFAVAALAAALLSRGTTGAQRGILCGAGLLVVAVALFARSGSEAAPADANGPTATDLGGVAVRTSLWSRAPAMLREHPLGIGPGQFQAAFPPFRDAEERRLSDGDPAAGRVTEVEHMHSDPVQGLVELGLVGGTAWLAFLVLAALACVRGLRSDDRSLACHSLALAGLLVNGLAHTPLTVQPTSMLIGFLLLGAVLARRAGDAPATALQAAVQRWFPLSTLVAFVFAWPLLLHGEALRGYVDAARRIDERLTETGGRVDPGDEVLREAALDARRSLVEGKAYVTESAPIWLLFARQAQPDERWDAWRAVLRQRPYHFEALVSMARIRMERDEIGQARELLQRARAVAPERPGAEDPLAKR